MKRITMFLLALITAFTFASCGYMTASTTYYKDIEDYNSVWELAGVMESEASVFPESVKGLETEEFFCRYDEQLPIGEGIQILVQIRYDDIESFRRETQRLQSLYADCDAYFDVDGYDFIASSLSGADFLEYAAIHENEQTVLYVYLQDLPYDEIEFDEKFIPIGYTGYGEIN